MKTKAEINILCTVVIIIIMSILQSKPCTGQGGIDLKDIVFYGFGRFDTLINDFDNIPGAFDLRNTGRLGKIKKQPARGCWAAASVSSLESVVRSSGYGRPDFSEKNLYLFHGFDSTRTGYGNHYMATAYFTRGGGPCLKGSRCDTLKCSKADVPFLVTEAIYLPGDPVIIKRSLMHCGAVYTMMNYTESIFDDSTHIYCYPLNKKINHVVNITGWDDNFDVPGGKGAWIIQNSRGVEYADSGFFHLCYRDASILEYNALWTEWMDNDNNVEILYYDTCGSYDSYGFKDTVACGLVKFTPDQDLDIIMLGFFLNNPQTEVTAKIYTRFDTATRTLDGLAFSSERYKFNYPGYYNIKLNKALAMKGSEDFFVEMRFISPGVEKPLPVEVFIKDYCDPHITNATCWVNPDSDRWPDAWYECGRNSRWPYLNFDICIRVYGIARPDMNE